MLRALLISGLLFSAPVLADDAEDFQSLIADFEAHENRDDPDENPDAAGRWGDLSPERYAEDRAADMVFLDRLEAIDENNLPAGEIVNFATLDYLLRFRVELAQFDMQRAPFSNDSGFFSTPLYVASSTRPRNVEAAENWIARLEDLPRYLDENIYWMREGIEAGYTQPANIIGGVRDQIAAIAAMSVEETGMVEPIDALPASVPDAERARLRAEAEAAVADHVLPAYQALLDFMDEEYVPAARTELGISSVPDGRAQYQALVRYHTTLDTSPEEVHQRGLAEVARIRSEMEAIIEEVGFDGTFAEFLNFMRTDPQFYAESEEELMMYASWLAKRADDAMPRFFGRLPRLPYGVRPVPASIAPTYTTGRYWPGSLENGVAGGYMVNTYNLSQRPLYNLPALTVHEAVPGHHHQIALAQELEDVPAFRRNTYITAFGEGWGLYTEFLAEEMGMYSTPYDQFGRLTYEMWRACRLVVDTGIHYMGWTRDQAEACFLENSALAPHNIRTEVSRYISWPGQALAYKTGELLMRDLRQRAETRLGEHFDIRDFHDELLSEGAVPLGYLENRTMAWIEATLEEAEAGEDGAAED
ncbi:DUF885 domain-containing protein [Hyphobacterium sp. CCMP332]|uniref:DUF885 domain-containing protein n=1 Tax=Hyphobacterium sp. CCMP332 TaxID=2749086 RepID=UPI00164F32F0|nr:DUF885 domain-containing protein [Hyphobacterium sp. CCMP332]QNL19724.1 DUF885 domain-containing protein [Hyphobacterium sp. CCMP332]